MTKPGIVSMLLIAMTSLSSAAACRSDQTAAGEKPQAGPMIGTKAGQVRDDNGIKLELVWCPAGTFKMGSPESENGRSMYSPADGPSYTDEGQVDVSLTRGFWLGRYEVTQDEWRRVMGSEPWKGKAAEFVNQGANIPAMYVTWDDANDFCQKLTGRERDAGRLPADWGFTLPTEAHWEYACRAGTTTAFFFGSDESKFHQHGWCRDERLARRRGHRDCWVPRSDEWARLVGGGKPNPWGFSDMHGNVNEWCRDLYRIELPGGADPELTNDQSGSRVIRGGSWYDDARGCRSAKRSWHNPRTGGNSIGFRVSLTVTE